MIQKYRKQAMEHIDDLIGTTITYVKSHKKLLVSIGAIIILYKWLLDDSDDNSSEDV